MCVCVLGDGARRAVCVCVCRSRGVLVTFVYAHRSAEKGGYKQSCARSLAARDDRCDGVEKESLRLCLCTKALSYAHTRYFGGAWLDLCTHTHSSTIV